MLVWPAAGRRRDAAVAVVLKIMAVMVVLVRVFNTTDKGEVSLTDLMLWNQNAAVEQSMPVDACGHTSSSSYGRPWKLVEGRRSGRSWEA